MRRSERKGGDENERNLFWEQVGWNDHPNMLGLSAELASAISRFVALTLTVIPETPMARMQEKGRFVMPDKQMLLEELYTFIEHANPTRAVFRTNHASNYLPIAGNLATRQRTDARCNCRSTCRESVCVQKGAEGCRLTWRFI